MHVFNHLQLIKGQSLKAKRLSEAQFLHLKAYRGVPYAKAPVEVSTGSKVATYRGNTYQASR